MLDGIIELLADIPAGWRVFILSMLPVTELRGALPLGVVWGLRPLAAYGWAVAGNFVPVIPLLVGLRWFLDLLLRSPRWRRWRLRLEQHSQANQEKVRRYGFVGLMLLVAVPLPGTGVWTGALVAVLLNLRFAPALLAITLGELIAGVLVCMAVSGVVAVSRLHEGEWILAAILLLGIAWFVIRKIKK